MGVNSLFEFKRKRENTFLYFFLSLTIGLPYTVIGALIALFVLVFLNKKVRYTIVIANRVFISMKGSFGGLNLGMFYILDENLTYDIASHEHEIGHSIQNYMLSSLIFIPFFAIPSLIRAALWDKIVAAYRKSGRYADYYSIYFERTANTLGELISDKVQRDYINKISERKVQRKQNAKL